MNTRHNTLRDFPFDGGVLDAFGEHEGDQGDGLAERPSMLDFISERVVSYVNGVTRNGRLAREALDMIGDLGGAVKYNEYAYEQADLPSDTKVVAIPDHGAVAVFVRDAVVHVLDQHVEDLSQADGYREAVVYGRAA